MAALTATRSGPRRRIAWLLAAAVLLALVAARMVWLHAIDPSFDAAFFAGAFLRSFQLGSLYALIAIGYTMVYGILRLINFAHGDVFMVGAFVAYFLFSSSPMPWGWALFVAVLVAAGFMRVLGFWRAQARDPVVIGGGVLALAVTALALHSVSLGWFWAMIASMFVTGVVGVLLDAVAYRPLRGAPRNSMLITAIAMSFFLENFGVLAFTTRQTPFRPATGWTESLELELFGGTVYTSWLIVLVPLATAVLVVALTLFVHRSRLGKAMRATAQDAEAAQMMGVEVNRVIATTFLLGSMLAAAAGVLWGLSFGSLNQPAIMGVLPGIKAFAAAVIGGIGSLPGAVIGGLVLGFLENFLTALLPRTADFPGITEYKDTFAFVALILILLLKPSGLVGEDLSEKV